VISLDDLAGVILEQCRAPKPAAGSVEDRLRGIRSERRGKWGELAAKPYSRPYTALTSRRIFLSEYELKRLLSDGSKRLVLPRRAIVSPLAEDWIAEKGIKIVREDE
jgi:hypothetical protein